MDFVLQKIRVSYGSLPSKKISKYFDKKNSACNVQLPNNQSCKI